MGHVWNTKTVLHVTTTNDCAICRSKVSSFIISYNTDRIPKRNAETYTKISKFPVFTEKIEHEQTASVYQALSLSGRGLGRGCVCMCMCGYRTNLGPPL